MTNPVIGKIREIIDQCQTENPCALDIRYDEPMREHTTFKVGGPADCWLCPRGDGFPAFCAAMLSRISDIPVFILGGGANVVVSDRGIRGIVLDTSAWKGETVTGTGLSFRSGTSLDEAAEIAAAAGFSGLEFLAGMPGSIGGAVWMNARCYGREIADVLTETEIIDFSEGGAARHLHLPMDSGGFGYKRSPFQGKKNVIISASFKLKSGNENEIRGEMEKNRDDRKAKGHYLFPCAGSVFKNNTDFGKPTGQIIDELGLRGFTVGGAQAAPFHGNIIINTGGASAEDIRSLTDEIAARVKERTGFILEPEILFAGEWH
ncbi:MAG: UDP-N-acetylmuramate dehydrogenase [Treponema sp.]|jgi:UDP-N-acetylmuramate dehydrogenase|nr:UDP-N-acetylmuramate dehydrogenase [Treponema sp.]